MKLSDGFFARDCLEVAPKLVGKLVCTKAGRLRIREVECYKGEADTACHARFGRTKRSEVLYCGAGTLYVYLCYGIHSLLNVVTGAEGEPQAVLIRACDGAMGPGKLTKALGITTSANRGRADGDEVWFEDDGAVCSVSSAKRVGIDYASEEDRERLWRFVMGD